VRPAQQSVRAQQAALGWTAGGASWLTETRAAFTRLRAFKLPESAFRSNVAAELGILGAPDDPFNYGLPFFIVTNYNVVIDDAILPQTQRDNLWQIGHDLSLLRGSHTIKAGFLGTRFHLNYQLSRLARGQYNFTGDFTEQASSNTPSGNPFADFLLGFPLSTSRNVGATLAYLRQSTLAAYIQDDWRISPALTVSLGLRYEYVAPFQPDQGTLLNLDYAGLPAPPTLQAVERPVSPDRNNFAPRVGLAWRMPPLPARLGLWTLRAGYGVYFNPEIATETYDLVRNGVRNENNSTDGLRPVLTIRDGFPQTATTGFPTYYGLDPDARTPYLQQWSAGFQRDLGRRAIFEIAYIGTKGSKLGRFRQLNTPLHTETGANLSPRPGALQQLRPFPSLGEIVQRQHISNSSYHGLQLRGEKRFSSSFSLLASFVWSKSIDDADSVIPGLFDSVGAQDERNLRLERGLSFYHVGRRLSVGFLRHLPSPRLWPGAFGGWELSGILTLQDGTPLNPVYFAADLSNTGTPNRPDVVPGVPIRLPREERTADRFFNTAAFREPARFTFGNAGRNILPGPGNNVLDLALRKRIEIRDTTALRFTIEAFNVFNHPNFGIPGPYPDFGPFFGKIFSTGDPRRLQLGTRLDF
jgi:outer membrane receptor protein involved in Fe transport